MFFILQLNIFSFILINLIFDWLVGAWIWQNLCCLQVMTISCNYEVLKASNEIRMNVELSLTIFKFPGKIYFKLPVNVEYCHETCGGFNCSLCPSKPTQRLSFSPHFFIFFLESKHQISRNPL